MNVDVLTTGEALAALRSTGPVRLAHELGLSVAGAELNVAIGLSRLGHAARWCGVLGEDQFGSLILRTLRAEGVDVSAVRRMAAPTGIIVFEPLVAGVTRVDYHRAASAGSRLSADDVLGRLPQRPRILHVTGITPALSECAADAIRQTVVRRARGWRDRVPGREPPLAVVVGRAGARHARPSCVRCGHHRRVGRRAAPW